MKRFLLSVPILGLLFAFAFNIVPDIASATNNHESKENCSEYDAKSYDDSHDDECEDGHDGDHQGDDCSDDHDSDGYGQKTKSDDCSDDHHGDDECKDDDSGYGQSSKHHSSDDCDDDGDHPDCVSGYNANHKVKVCPPPPPVDKCPNLDGVQSEVPAGMEVDGYGNCVEIPPPPAVPTLTANGVCTDNMHATISGNVSGFTGNHIFVGAIINGDDIAGSQTLTDNGSYSFVISRDIDGFRDLDSVHVFVMASDQVVGNTQLSNLVELDVDFTECPPDTTVPPTTEPPATTTPPTTAPPTTTPVTTTPVPPTTTQPPAKTTPPTTTPTGELPHTGNGEMLAMVGLVLIMSGCLLVGIARWRRNWSKIGV